MFPFVFTIYFFHGKGRLQMFKLSFFPVNTFHSSSVWTLFCWSLPFGLSLFVMFHWVIVLFLFIHISPCAFSSFCVFFISLFFPLFGQFYHHHPDQTKNWNSFETKIQLNEWPDQTKTLHLHLHQNPTHQPEPSGPPQEVKCYSPSSTNILVSWRPPPVELQNGIITQYTIQYTATEGEDTTTREISGIPPESSQYLLENLEKWTEYRVTVTAHTDVGAGPESLPQLIRTEEDGMCSQKQSPQLQNQSTSLNLPRQILTSSLISTTPSTSLPSACL